MGPEFLEKQPFRLIVVTPGHTLTGDVHLTSEAILSAFLESRSPVWIPMTDVQTRSLADRRVISRYEFRPREPPPHRRGDRAAARNGTRAQRPLTLGVHSRTGRNKGVQTTEGGLGVGCAVQRRIARPRPIIPVLLTPGHREMPNLRGLLRSRPKMDEEELGLAQSRAAARLADLGAQRRAHPTRLRQQPATSSAWSGIGPRRAGFALQRATSGDRRPAALVRPSSWTVTSRLAA